MSELLRWELDEGSVVVEVDDDEPGFQPASLSSDGVVYNVAERFDAALLSTRTAAEKALSIFREGAIRPDGVELEFGVKLNAVAGAVIAKAAAEAHLKVKLTWTRDRAGPASSSEEEASPSSDQNGQ